MKTNSIYLRCVAAAVAVLAGVSLTANAADEVIPRIAIVDVPLPDAIRNLARQAEFNFIFDPRVPGSEFGPGRFALKPSVTIRLTNASAQTALDALLKEPKLVMVTNPATSVARIALANQSVKPVPASQVGTNSSKEIPLMVMDSVSLTEALAALAREAGLTVALDPKLSVPAFNAQGTVSFRWERITARQALAALFDNYDLVMIEDAVTSAARIVPKTGGEEKRP